MDVLFPDTGFPYLLRQSVGAGLRYHLFTNDHTPTLSDTLASFTEANWSSYAPIDVLAAAWSTLTVDEHVGGLEAGPIVWLNFSMSAQVVYGYFVTELAGGTLFASARFDLAPITIPLGGTYAVTPQLGTYSGLTA